MNWALRIVCFWLLRIGLHSAALVMGSGNPQVSSDLTKNVPGGRTLILMGSVHLSLPVHVMTRE